MEEFRNFKGNIELWIYRSWEIYSLGSNPMARDAILLTDMNSRFRRNAILEVTKGNEEINFVACVKEVIKEHFTVRFVTHHTNRPTLNNINFPCLSPEESESLEEFSVEEIKEVLFGGNSDKSTGLDDFNLKFVKKCWDTVGGEITGVIQEFHSKGKLPK